VKIFSLEIGHKGYQNRILKNLGYDLGVHVGLIYEKRRRPRFSCYCPFRKSPSRNFFLLRGYQTPRNSFEFEYIHKFETELEKNLGYASGVYVGQLMKKQEAESRATSL
jgi:hypothetical protein